MTREEIHNEIGNILKLIEINNNRMFLNDTDFELDLELLKSHIVKLYGLYDQLKVSDDSGAPESTEAPAEVKKPEPIVIQAKPKVRAKKVAVEIKPEPKKVEEPVVETPKIVEPPIVEQKEAVEEVEPPVKRKKLAIKTPTKAPRNDIYTRFQNTKIDSIKKGISISKRYEIQNELFSNNPTDYNEAIKTLDSQSSFDAATAYLEGTLMVNHQWEEDDVLVDELRLLLYRRYM
ncbi:MAG: type IV secretory pathway VirB10-like protein [Bacteroidia bacterium]|jgi:type IV secretory pathway VirB10-like protein